MGDNGIRLVRPGCIRAFEDFLEEAKGLRYASAELAGTYYPDRNSFKPADPSKTGKSRGRRLVLSVGGDGTPLANYAFGLRDLKAETRSPRFEPSGKDKPPVMATYSEPGAEAADVLRLRGAESRLERNAARAMNSIPFGMLFEGWEGAPGREEDAVAALYPAAEAFVKGGSPGKLTAAYLEGPGGKEGPEGAAASWMLTDMAASLTGEAGGPYSKELARMASSAMGLDDLMAVLKEADGMAAGARKGGPMPDLAGMLDPGTQRGRGALCGLCWLAAYKQCLDRGSASKDADGHTVVALYMDNEKHAAVFDRLAYAMSDAEAREARESEAEAGRDALAAARCFQATFAGTPQDGGPANGGRAASARTDLHQKYRFYRAAALGEDPDMPSGAPAFQMFPAPGTADASKAPASGFLVRTPAEDRDVPLDEFLKRVDAKDPRYAAVLDGLPALKDASGERGALEAALLDRAREGGGEPVDALAAEIAAFNASKDRLMAEAQPSGCSGSSLQAASEEAYQAHVAGGVKLAKSLDDLCCRPDSAHGTAKFGYCWIRAMEDAGVRQPVPPQPGGVAQGSSAAAFRQADADRQGALDLAERLSGGTPRGMDEAEALVLAHGKDTPVRLCLDMAAGYANEMRTDPLRGSSRMNDFVVLSECYGIRDAEGFRRLGRDIDAAYGGPEAAMLYRPRNLAEKDALAAVYGKGDLPLDAAYRAPGDPGGLAGALSGGAGVPGRLEAAADVLDAKALERDTFRDHGLADLADRIRASLPKQPMGPTERLLDMQSRERQDGAPGQDGPKFPA